MKLVIRPIDPRHEPAVPKLLDEAFEGQSESRLVSSLRADEHSWIPELSPWAIASARHSGEALVVVLGHPEYYPRFGFTPAAEQGITSPWNVPAEAWMLLELTEGAATGVTGVVSYPAAFYDAL